MTGLGGLIPGPGALVLVARKAAPYLGAAALVLCAYWWADGRGREAQREKDAKQITYIAGARDGWKRNAQDTRRALLAANASIVAAQRDADARVAAAKKASRDAQRASRGLVEEAAALRASAALKRTPATACEPSSTLQKAWAP